MADPASIGLAILQVLYTMVYTFYCIIESIARTCLPRDYFKKDIAGQIVLVTGGGSGIGRLMCLKFAARGAKIVTWDVNPEGNAETVRQIADAGGFCRGYTVDLCNRKDVYASAKRVKEEVGKVDILVNNAGIVTGKKLLESPDESIIRTFEVNSLSHFWTVKAFLGDMLLSNRGHIVSIASMAGWIGANGLVDYCSSKFAAVGFDEALRLELKAEGATGIKTTVVCPIYISTGMFEGVVTNSLFPILSPEWVASEAVDATLMDVPVLMLPKHMRIGLILRHILPDKVNYKLAQLTGVTTMMNGFVGRRKEE
ncbi:short-chain dehydrogenase/reductase family 16C member 6-like [Palaemon carinicauda]|uniref:short-chain dehydrogenase/reductase family 16C member 6-like n=1 Tax=Palaemon carinicauda TaxID=392227 RepID=UPI0035B5DFBC